MTTSKDSGSYKDWSETRLWRSLSRTTSRDGAKVKPLLEQWMPDIQKILRSADTSPPDFTLHDADHSFRVAEWMAEIVPAGTLKSLSPCEKALLLLSAYLHDIGMTPEQGLVNRHWRHLLYGPAKPDDPQQLSEPEIIDLQRWLDDQNHPIQMPLSAGLPTEDQKREADHLIAHYARARHNDWSERWIRANHPGDGRGPYPGWLEDLVLLCRSHHLSTSDLAADRYDPRLVTSKSIVHLRYLACVLRVADILDVDPERTPDVVFAHRSISRDSVPYWQKDHALLIQRDDRALVVSARPQQAVIERAVRQTAEGIEAELRGCCELDRKCPFSHGTFRKAPLPYSWDFPEFVSLQVKPQDERYVYIDGAFRPNTTKLLDLLSGVNLYGDPMTAVRELLQNAFDAVREDIGLRRLNERNPGDPAYATRLAEDYRVELRFEHQDGHYWLVCTDNGVGMTQKIICDYLLVSGRGTRHDILELERRCASKGFTLNRTGQFGIGVLSYFMIADRIEIRTRRTQHYEALEPAEATGWYFEIEGLESFGELRRVSKPDPGTEVRLRLKPDQVDNPKRWFDRLVAYLLDQVKVPPCAVDITSPLQDCRGQNLGPAWRCLLEDCTSDLFRTIGEKSPARSLGDRLNWDRQRQDWEQVEREVTKCISWRVTEGSIPGDLGTYRILVPVFNIQGGHCAAFLRPSVSGKRTTLEPIDGHPGLTLEPPLVNSWRGVAVSLLTDDLEDDGDSASFTNDSGARVEIDWTSSAVGTLSVDRQHLRLTRKSEEAFDAIIQKAREETRKAFEGASSKFQDLNRVLCGATARGRMFWARTDSSGRATWGPVAFPVFVGGKYDSVPRQARLARRKAEGLQPLMMATVSTGHDEAYPLRALYPPDRIVLLRHPGGGRNVVPLWLRGKSDRTNTPSVWTSRFPPNWPEMAGMVFDVWGIHQRILNHSHVLTKTIDAVALDWYEATEAACAEATGLLGDPLRHRTDILSTRARAAVWILRLIEKRETDTWTALLKHGPEFCADIWQVLFGRRYAPGQAEMPRIIFCLQHSLIEISLQCGRRLELSTLPCPPAGWVLSELAPRSTKRRP